MPSTPSTGSGKSQLTLQGHTSGRFGSEPHARTKGDNSATELRIKPKS